MAAHLWSCGAEGDGGLLLQLPVPLAGSVAPPAPTPLGSRDGAEQSPGYREQGCAGGKGWFNNRLGMEDELLPAASSSVQQPGLRVPLAPEAECLLLGSASAGRGAWQTAKLHGWKDALAAALPCSLLRRCGMLQGVTHTGPRASLGEGLELLAVLHSLRCCPVSRCAWPCTVEGQRLPMGKRSRVVARWY